MVSAGPSTSNTLKTKFLAGTSATLVAFVFVVGISIFLVLVLDVDASRNWFTYSAAFLTIAVWMGIYKLVET